MVEVLEPRRLMSAVSAVNDTLVIRGANSVVIDVLKNDSTDTSGDGTLDITSVLVNPNYGTLQIVAGDTTKTGAEAHDQVRFQAAGGFTGTAEFSYGVTDAEGGTDVAYVTVQVGAGPSGFVSGSGDGQLATAGGLGGTNYQITPLTGYVPTVSGNYTTTETTAGGWTRGVAVGNGVLAGTGNQGITRTVTVSSGAAGTSSYVEIVTWNYDLLADDGNGNDNHVWGSYTSMFSVIDIGPSTTTSLTFDSFDYYDSHSVTSSATASYANHASGNSIYMLSVSNTDSAIGPDSGSQSETTISTGNTVGTGSYSYALAGGGVSGTLNGNSNDLNQSMYSIGFTQDAFGNWLGGGITSFLGTGTSHFGHVGSGGYGDANFTGTVTDDSGSHDTDYNYLGGGLFSDLTGWTLTGTGSAGGGDQQNFQYTGTGIYSSDANGVVKNGTTSANGGNQSQSGHRVTYGLSDGVWVTTLGSASGGGGSTAFTDYAGTGSYTRSENNGTVTGKLEEDGHTNSWNNYGTNSTLNAATGVWTTSGSGSNGADGHTDISSSGSGDYHLSTGQVGGASYSQTDGEVNESANKNTGYQSSAQWLLGTNGWSMDSGSANESSDEGTKYASSGGGTYTRQGSAPGSDYVYSTSGKILDSQGSNNSSNGWTTNHTVNNGQWQQSGGTGYADHSNKSSSKFEGGGTYSYTNGQSAPISGTTTEEGNDSSGNDWSTSSNWKGGNWTTTGTQLVEGKSHSESGYSGSGSYGWSNTPMTGGYGNSSYSGNVTEEGDSHQDQASSVNYALDKEGQWGVSGGTRSGSGGSNYTTESSGSGSYMQAGNDPEMGVWLINGTTASSGGAGSFNDWASESKIDDGWWVGTSGHDSSSGYASQNSSSSGSGNYTYYDGTVNVVADVTQDGHNNSGNDWSTGSVLAVSANGAATSGTGTSASGGGGASGTIPTVSQRWDDSGDYHETADKGRSMNFTISTGSYSRAIEGGTASGTVTGSILRKSDTDWDYKSKLVQGEYQLQSGNYFTVSLDGESVGYNGGGSYSLGDDIHDDAGNVVGNWTYNGNITESGNDYSGEGFFSKEAVVAGEWEETDFGAAFGNGSSNNSSDNGTGSWTNGGISGNNWDDTQGGYKFDVLVTDGFASGLTGSASESSSGSSNSGHDASGNYTDNGLTGPYESHSNSDSEGDWQIDYQMDDLGFFAVGGHDNSQSHNDSSMSYVGTGSYTLTKGGTGTASRDTGYDNSNDSSSKWEHQGTVNGWVQTEGTAKSHVDEHDNSAQSGTGTYTAAWIGGPTGLTGNHSEESHNNWSYALDSEDTYDGTAKTWTYDGEGTDTFDSGSKTSYDLPSVAFTSGTTTGTYEENGHSNLFDAAEATYSRAANGGWDVSGDGAGGGDGHAHEKLEQLTTWTNATSNGGTMSGATELKRGSDGQYNYSYEQAVPVGTTKANESAGVSVLANAGSLFQITSGTGSGDGSANSSLTSSGSGTYSRSIHDGAGTLNGTQSGDSHDRWDYAYNQTFTYDAGNGGGGTNGSGGGAAKGWVTTETGQGSADWHEHAESSGSGAYSNSSTVTNSGTNGSGVATTLTSTNAQTGSVEESRDALDSWNATFSWDGAAWQVGQNWSGTSQSDSHDQRESTVNSTSTTGSFASGNGSFSNSSGTSTFDEVTHAESQSQGQRSDTFDPSTGQTWEQSSSGTGSNWRERTDDHATDTNWGVATDTTYHSRTDTGSSSFVDHRHDKWTETDSHALESKSDGSSTKSLSTDWQHDWDSSKTGSGQNAWTETWTTPTYTGYGGYGGGGGGTTTTTSGSVSNSWGSSGKGSDSSNYSVTMTTPANPPTNPYGTGTGGTGTGGTNAAGASAGGSTQANGATANSVQTPANQNAPAAAGQNNNGGRTWGQWLGTPFVWAWNGVTGVASKIGQAANYVYQGAVNFLADGIRSQFGDAMLTAPPWKLNTALVIGAAVGIGIAATVSAPFTLTGVALFATASVADYMVTMMVAKLLEPQTNNMTVEGIVGSAIVGGVAGPLVAGLAASLTASFSKLATKLKLDFLNKPLSSFFPKPTGGVAPKTIPANSLTASEVAEIQALAKKYNTTIDVVGSRAAGEGNNIGTNLPVGKQIKGGPPMRSDIDFRIDAAHPQAEALIQELQKVGNGAGSAGLDWTTNPLTPGGRPTEPPFIRFNGNE